MTAPSITKSENRSLINDKELRTVKTLIEDMLMKSETHGTAISEIEVTNVSQHGFWILLNEKELFLPFSEFPWFKEASVSAIFNVELPHPRHLYWPDLDIDLAVESIEHPERFPLVSKAMPNSRPEVVCQGVSQGN